MEQFHAVLKPLMFFNWRLKLRIELEAFISRSKNSGFGVSRANQEIQLESSLYLVRLTPS